MKHNKKILLKIQVMNINVHLIIQNVIFITLLYAYSVKCVPCYLSMVHPQVVDGGDGLQM